MRLTKEMKRSLFTIISNRTKNPVKQETLDDLLTRFQNKIYEVEPIFKQFLDTYPDQQKHFKSEVGIYIKGKSVYTTELSLYMAHPYVDFYGLFKPSVHEIARKVRVVGYYAYKINYEDCSEHLKPEYKPFFDELYELALKLDQYKATLEELETHLKVFTTDTALLKVYPEFEEFFLQAGISKTPKKYLPSVTGLPNSLANYGLTFKNAEPTEESVPETVTEELQSLGHNV